MTFDDVTRRERTISGALALGMHLLFLLLLVVGVSWQQKRPDSAVVVELWSELPPAPQPKAAPPPPEPPRQAPRPEPRPEPQPEPKPVPKPDIALNEQLIKKRKQQEQREKAEREQKEREQKLAKEKLEKERKLKEELEAKKRKEKELAEQRKRDEKKREDEKKRLAALKQKEDAKRREQELQEMLRRQAQQAAQAAAQSRLDAYSRLVGDKIKRYIVLPPNIQGNPEAIFEVVQMPGGDILDAKLKRSSGNPAYDAAVERAIRKAQPLPPPPDPARFSEVRELELKFRPKE